MNNKIEVETLRSIHSPKILNKEFDENLAKMRMDLLQMVKENNSIREANNKLLLHYTLP